MGCKCREWIWNSQKDLKDRRVAFAAIYLSNADILTQIINKLPTSCLQNFGRYKASPMKKPD